MHFKHLLSTTISLACLSAASAAATDLELAAPPSVYALDNIKRGLSTFDARQEPPPAPPVDPNDPNAPRLVQIVRVGDNNGSLKFFPEKVSANKGDVIQFHFYPKNHTITESLFAQPCKPLPAENATETRPGQKSGFIPVAADVQFRPIYNLIVNDTRPMWIFCGQMPHCQKGMAMVINQNETDTEKTLEKYKEAAAALPLPSPPPGGNSAPPPGSPPPTSASAPATPTASTVVPAGQSTTGGSGPSLVGTSSPTASIQPFTGGANRDLAAWGSTWSVGLLGLVGVGIWL